VSAWISASPDNQKLVEEILFTIEATSRLHIMKTVDVDKAYLRFRSKVRTPKKTVFLSGFQQIAAVFFIPLILSTAYLFWKNQETGSKATVEIINPNPRKVEINTAPGVLSIFDLPDGSKVWLNAGSSLKYEWGANADTRMVELKGEAYFEVKSNPDKPFIVKTGEDVYNIEVLGTSFNVSAYSDDDLIKTTLVEGSVKLNIKSKEGRESTIILKADQKVEYHKENKTFSVADVQVDLDTDWMRREILFRRDSMEYVLKKLSRRYNVRFDVKNRDIYNGLIHATFKDETILQIMEYLNLTSGLRYNVREPFPEEDSADRIIIEII
jgi:ferric-dicitrate binding protein FerR (iron transport regulator)